MALGLGLLMVGCVSTTGEGRPPAVESSATASSSTAPVAAASLPEIPAGSREGGRSLHAPPLAPSSSGADTSPSLAVTTDRFAYPDTLDPASARRRVLADQSDAWSRETEEWATSLAAWAQGFLTLAVGFRAECAAPEQERAVVERLAEALAAEREWGAAVREHDDARCPGEGAPPVDFEALEEREGDAQESLWLALGSLSMALLDWSASCNGWLDRVWRGDAHFDDEESYEAAMAFDEWEGQLVVTLLRRESRLSVP